ncbi:hypothetical protein MTO96_011848 [Rhipicephalus appendiculatus]
MPRAPRQRHRRWPIGFGERAPTQPYTYPAAAWEKSSLKCFSTHVSHSGRSLQYLRADHASDSGAYAMGQLNVAPSMNTPILGGGTLE